MLQTISAKRAITLRKTLNEWYGHCSSVLFTMMIQCEVLKNRIRKTCEGRITVMLVARVNNGGNHTNSSEKSS